MFHFGDEAGADADGVSHETYTPFWSDIYIMGSTSEEKILAFEMLLCWHMHIQMRNMTNYEHNCTMSQSCHRICHCQGITHWSTYRADGNETALCALIGQLEPANVAHTGVQGATMECIDSATTGWSTKVLDSIDLQCREVCVDKPDTSHAILTGSCRIVLTLLWCVDKPDTSHTDWIM